MIDVLRGHGDETFAACLCDPPYGLSFMGKGWDHGVPGEAYWAEVLRVLSPGAVLLAFGGTRTYHRLVCAIEDAGFEVFDSLMYLYGSGFPKSRDIRKAIDKETEQDRAVWDLVEYGEVPSKDSPFWDGYGTALKPSYEPIVLARKPRGGTYAKCAVEHGGGALNVDGCRVGTKTGWTFMHSDKTSRSAGIMGNISGARDGVAQSHPSGR